MKVLVTGAAGFIGSHLSEFLLGKGHEVIGIDNFDPFYPKEIKKQNILVLEKEKKFQFFEIDLRSQTELEKIFSNNSVDVVVHLAAKAGVRPSIEDPRGYVSTNIDGTLSLLEAAKKYQVTKWIFASSSSVYGKNETIPFKEEDKLDETISHYATTKLAGEEFTRLYHNLYQFSVANLRFFTVYGPRQRPDLAIHKFMRALIKGEEVTVFGDGSMARDYTFVEDTIQGIWGAINLVANSSTPIYQVYNLGNSTPITLIALLEQIEKTSGLKFKRKSAAVPLGDVPITYADISKAKKDLGYLPRYPLDSGLKKMWDWIVPLYRK